MVGIDEKNNGEGPWSDHEQQFSTAEETNVPPKLPVPEGLQQSTHIYVHRRDAVGYPNFSPQSTSRENGSPRTYIITSSKTAFYKQPAKEAKQGAAGTKSLGPTEGMVGQT